ncbi:MAG: amidohydrolase [Clostridia bacterium]|nr:amidohydrolase [Clostridia bacterium]
MSGLLIRDTIIVPVDNEKKDKLWFTGDVAIEESKIKEVGKNLQGKYRDFEIIEGKNSLTMPGFVNCHTHAAMTMLRGYADDLPIIEWLSEKIWPCEEHLTEKDIYWGTKLAISEMVKSGTTTFADMYSFMDQVAYAVDESGIRASLSRGIIGKDEEKDELALRESEEFVKEWHGKGEGRITCMLGPHAPYTCSPAYIKKIKKLANELGVGIHIHLAEALSEVEDIKSRYKMRPIELMDSIGLFTGGHVLAAHCVHLSKEEINILVNNNVGIAHNPQSNMKLASGIAPLPILLEKGALVGLGTDGAASNNNLDMLEEMRTCALFHKVSTMDPTVLSAYQVLKMSTREGARVLGLNDVGTLAVGQKADVIMFDLKKPHMTPLHDPIANIVYSAQSADVKTVIVNGKIIMKDRSLITMDEEKIIFEAQRLGEDLVKRK